MISVRELADVGIVVIEPGVRLTLSNAHEFVRIVQTVPVGFGPSVIVNLEQTVAVDSAGVGALVNARNHIKKVSGSFALAGLRPEIQRTFQLMNLYQVFDIYEDEVLARKHMIARKG